MKGRNFGSKNIRAPKKLLVKKIGGENYASDKFQLKKNIG